MASASERSLGEHAGLDSTGPLVPSLAINANHKEPQHQRSFGEDADDCEQSEQMARGRPIIASAIGGLGEIVGDAGLTFSPGDPRALADAMRRILDEPDLGASLGARGRRRILLSFSYGGMIEEHARIYREVSATTKA